MLHRLFCFRLTLGLTVFILLLCLMPVPETPLSDVSFADKYTHILMFGGYAWCLWAESGAASRRERPALATYALAVLWPTLFGGIVEVLQAALTDVRCGDILDFAADAVGVLLFAVPGRFTYAAVQRR